MLNNEQLDVEGSKNRQMGGSVLGSPRKSIHWEDRGLSSEGRSAKMPALVSRPFGLRLWQRPLTILHYSILICTNSSAPSQRGPGEQALLGPLYVYWQWERFQKAGEAGDSAWRRI